MGELTEKGWSILHSATLLVGELVSGKGSFNDSLLVCCGCTIPATSSESGEHGELTPASDCLQPLARIRHKVQPNCKGVREIQSSSAQREEK